jgi:glycosyltransferase involved in cell wall biosynthesis
LAALLAQQFDGSYEVIVCDDGSTASVLDELHANFDAAGVPVRYVWQQDRSVRAASARNNGIKLSQGRILVFLDGDMIPTPDVLTQHLHAHRAEKLIICGNRLWYGGDPAALLALPIVEIWTELRAKSFIKQKVYAQQKSWARSEKNWRACFSCHMSVAYSPVVFFDENIVGWGTEDWDIAYRLVTECGYRVIFRDDIVAYHCETGQINNPFQAGSHEQIVQWMSNISRFEDKHPQAALLELYNGCQRFALDPNTNRWYLRLDQPTDYNLAEVRDKIRSWLAANGVYPARQGVSCPSRKRLV